MEIILQNANLRLEDLSEKLKKLKWYKDKFSIFPEIDWILQSYLPDSKIYIIPFYFGKHLKNHISISQISLENWKNLLHLFSFSFLPNCPVPPPFQSKFNL